MKKIILLVVIIIITILIISNKNNVCAQDEEVRGVFISYLEYQKILKGKSNDEIIDEVDRIINNLNKYYINTIYLQVRMFSDSIYPSKIFPFTDMIANYQGEYIGLDILELFINKAHNKNIKLYAWINPYRISNYIDTSRIAKSNPAFV